MTQHKLNLVQKANDIEDVERVLDEGHIEESLEIAQDELKLVSKMAEWKACVCCVVHASLCTDHPVLRSPGGNH